MANPTWPASLPDRVLRQGYSEKTPDVKIRTPTETGPAKMRRRFTAGVEPIRARLALTAAQRATLRTFFETTLAGGTLAFDWVRPSDQAAVTFRFTGQIEFTPHGNNWIAAFDLEITP